MTGASDDAAHAIAIQPLDEILKQLQSPPDARSASEWRSLAIHIAVHLKSCTQLTAQALALLHTLEAKHLKKPKRGRGRPRKLRSWLEACDANRREANRRPMTREEKQAFVQWFDAKKYTLKATGAKATDASVWEKLMRYEYDLDDKGMQVLSAFFRPRIYTARDATKASKDKAKGWYECLIDCLGGGPFKNRRSALVKKRAMKLGSETSRYRNEIRLGRE